MRMQVKLEIGHKASCRQEMTQEGYTHDWTVFVRGSEGKDISHFVEKVVFHLHESFPRPKRAVKEPPFKLEERGYGSFELKIEVCFKTRDEPRKVMFNYDLFLPLMDYPPVSNVRTEALTFTHPTEEFMRKLIKGGGLQISASNGVGSNGVSNGHGNTSRDESKEVAQKSANVPDISEKGKKPKLPKPNSKTAPAPAAVIGGKRSSPSPHDHAPDDVTAKKKKKLSENPSSLSKGKHSVPVANDKAPVPLTTEVKDLKVKIKPVPPKEPEKKNKEPGLASNHKGKVPTHSSKGKEVKSHTAAAENASAGSESTKAKSEPTIEHKTKLKKKGEKTEKRSHSKKDKEKKDKEKKDKEKKDKEKKDKEKKDKEKKDKEKKDKEKKDQEKKDQEKKDQEKKDKEKREKEKKTIEKVLIRRSSGDSWASSGSSSGLLSNVMSKNKALGKLLNEISDDEDGGENLPTPFKRETSPVPLKNSPETVIKEPVTIATEKAASLNSSKHKPKENTARLNHSNGNNSSEINVHNTIKENCTSGIEADVTKKSTSAIEVDATKKSTSGIEVDITKKSTSGIEVDVTKKSTSGIEADVTKKSTDDVKNRSPAKSEEKNGLSGLSKKELYDLYDQIMSCQDSDSLQNVVDIIESTGLYKVSDKTFEFDLCCLEKTTLRKIQKCLASR